MTFLQRCRSSYDFAQRIASEYLGTHCLQCQVATKAATQLCETCWQALPVTKNPCYQCGVPLLGQDTRCGHCVSGKTTFDNAYIPFVYRAEIRQSIIDLKYHSVLANAYLLSEWMWQRWEADDFPIPDAILPMPLHVERVRERGFNQSVELARLFARRWQRPILYDAVVRQKDTRKQTGLSMSKRIGNVSKAFVATSMLGYEHIAIFDDVITTGATIDSLVRVLRQHRVRQISVIAAARAIT